MINILSLTPTYLFNRQYLRQLEEGKGEEDNYGRNFHCTLIKFPENILHSKINSSRKQAEQHLFRVFDKSPSKNDFSVTNRCTVHFGVLPPPPQGVSAICLNQECKNCGLHTRVDGHTQDFVMLQNVTFHTIRNNNRTGKSFRSKILKIDRNKKY